MVLVVHRVSGVPPSHHSPRARAPRPPATAPRPPRPGLNAARGALGLAHQSRRNHMYRILVLRLAVDTHQTGQMRASFSSDAQNYCFVSISLHFSTNGQSTIMHQHAFSHEWEKKVFPVGMDAPVHPILLQCVHESALASNSLFIMTTLVEIC